MADMKDRHSRMITSSVHAPAKKDGAGGSYTWGGMMDVMDYEPVAALQEPKVHTDFPATQSWGPTATINAGTASAGYPAFNPTQSANLKLLSNQEFPTLAATTGGDVTRAAGSHAVVWGPQPPAPPPVRESVPEFNAQHPRNAFAKKPHVTTTTTVVQAPGSNIAAIDWSQPGNTVFNKEAVKVAATSASHVSVYANPRPAPTREMLAARPSPAAYIPKPTKHEMGKQVFSKCHNIMQPQQRRGGN